MIEPDTIKLLRECDAGIKMGVASIDDVPTHAVTLTVPALAAGKHMFCTVPAKTKAWAVEKTVMAEISKEIPATIMRRHPDAMLFCDPDSAEKIMR